MIQPEERLTVAPEERLAVAPEERLAAVLARLILDPAAPPARHIAVGAASPIPAAAAWLVRKMGHPVRLSLLHKRSGNPFTDGSRELFDLAGQGRIDLFFLGGGQIDGAANINLIGTGPWPGGAEGQGARFPGSFGSAFMYMMTPRTILFREEHSRRVLVPKVDIISAAGVTPPEIFRRGTAQALVTGRCTFHFNPQTARFTLATTHPGNTTADIQQNTGFTYDGAETAPTTPDPTPEELTLLRTTVRAEMLETYPDFCEKVWGNAA